MNKFNKVVAAMDDEDTNMELITNLVQVETQFTLQKEPEVVAAMDALPQQQESLQDVFPQYAQQWSYTQQDEDYIQPAQQQQVDEKSTIMELFEKFKCIGASSNKILKTEDLVINKQYKILSIKKVSTKFGEQLKLTIPEGRYYLPKRFITAFTDEELQLIVKNIPEKASIVYIGKGSGRMSSPQFNFNF